MHLSPHGFDHLPQPFTARPRGDSPQAQTSAKVPSSCMSSRRRRSARTPAALSPRGDNRSAGTLAQAMRMHKTYARDAAKSGGRGGGILNGSMTDEEGTDIEHRSRKGPERKGVDYREGMMRGIGIGIRSKEETALAASAAEYGRLGFLACEGRRRVWKLAVDGCGTTVTGDQECVHETLLRTLNANVER
ncbi:hypothetical protein DFH09DRAFT_1418934 [Mycena vulgaris]|nr:hypothetical protein DFH09DRAFT_1418934 [Mycena vulgaris]